MGERFRDRDSLHLSAPGWQTIGVLFDDIHHRLKLDATKRGTVIVALGAIDWSRNNLDWQSTGVLAQGKNKAGETVLKFGGGGRSNRAALLDYVRHKTGLNVMLAKLDQQAAA